MWIPPPPYVVNALSVEPTKPRLILSMRAVNLFCQDKPFKLTPLSDIVRHIPDKSLFAGLDDTQGYKHLALTEESVPFCGFEFAGHWFADTTVPFGWKNSACAYLTVGEVFSEWLRSLGVYTELWIDDRFLGLAPPPLIVPLGPVSRPLLPRGLCCGLRRHASGILHLPIQEHDLPDAEHGTLGLWH